MNVLHIQSHMSYSGSNKELTALAADQRAAGNRVRVCCLGSRGPWTGWLEARGVPVVTLDWTRWFDVTPPWQLRDLLGGADIEAIQIWGPEALRWVGLLKPSLLARAIFCPPLPHARQPFDCWLLGLVGRVVVRDDAEKNRATALGAKPETTMIVPLGVSEIVARAPVAKERNLVAGVGPLEKSKNFRDAIWSMDILNELFPNLDLELVGQGSQRESLLEFSTRFQKTRLRLLGGCVDVPAHLAEADLCWLPGVDGCRHAALEAMAAGRPLVASNLPHLRDLIPDGEAGFFVSPGDKIALARKTRTLVLDPELRQRMGNAGQRHVRSQFPQDAFLQRWREVMRTA